MLRTLLATILLTTALTSAQRSLPPKQRATVMLGQTPLRLGMRRAEVVALLAPKFRIEEHGLVLSTSAPFEVAGTVGFTDDGVLKYISRSWNPVDQRAGVPTVEALYNGLLQLAGMRAVRDSRGQSADVCTTCSVFLYESNQGVKNIEIFDGAKTISMTVTPSVQDSPAAVLIQESIGGAGK